MKIKFPSSELSLFNNTEIPEFRNLGILVSLKIPNYATTDFC